MSHDAPGLAERLAQLVRIATVTPADSGDLTPETAAVFADFHERLRDFYPTLFTTAEVTPIGRAGLLLRVAGTADAASSSPGSAPNGAADGTPHSLTSATSTDVGATSLGPVLLMAHQDVVPAPVEGWAEAGWSHPPFAGTVEDGQDGLTVYGRGTLDDKGALLVVLEAVEDLVTEDWHPHGDLWLLLGADEESYGACAIAAAEELDRRGVRPVMVVDEGGAVASGVFPGLTRPVAIVGVAEKGLTTLEIVVSADPRSPGHASTPPRRSAPAGLGRAIVALERHPHPASLDDVALRLFRTLAPYVPGPLGRLLSRTDTLRPVLGRLLPVAGAELAAMVRTTTAVTMLEGSAAPNVLAATARATVNMRVATSSSVAEATTHVDRVVRRAVGRGLDVAVRVVEASEPTPPSPMDERWDAICAASAAAYPDAIPVPYTMLAASDSRHVARIAPAIYRFAPLFMSAAQRAGVHGVDERVSADSLVRGVRFYRALLAPDV